MSSCSSYADGESSGQIEPPDPEAIEIDPTRRYVRYKDVLGKGAFKTVYKGFDELDGIEVAWNQIKIEDVTHSPNDRERLYSEINLLKSVKHENIMKFYASWIDDENKTINIITELFTSGNLRQYRRKHKKVDIKVVKGWARQILAGLDYLHSQKSPIIHRDIKCDNIFINGNNGEVKIGDLGLATIMHKANAQTVIGTPEFMAPELYDEDYNELVDIYSFGMCMLEMVTFEYPYSECTNSAQIFKKVSTGVKPVALSKVKDLEVKNFIEKCLVPACQRLPARDLLNDSFLWFDGSIEARHNMFCPSSGIENYCCEVPHVSRKWNSVNLLYTSNDDVVTISSNSSNGIGESGSHCIQLEPKSKTLKSLNCVGYDSVLRKPIIHTFANSSSDQHLMTLEVEEESKYNTFRLRGSRSGAGSISLILWIKGQKGCVQSEFPFYIGSDTSSSVATEIVEYFNLAAEDVQLIAYLIDSLCLHLVPGWEIPVSINHTIKASQSVEGSSQFFVDGETSVGSFCHSSEATVSLGRKHYTYSTNGYIQFIHDDAPLVQAGPNILQTFAKSLSCADSSFCAPLVQDGPNILQTFAKSLSCADSSFCSKILNHSDCNGCEMARDMDIMLSKSEISLHLDQRDRDLGIQTISDASTFSDIFSNGSSTFADKGEFNKSDVDEELLIELEVLELHFQSVIDYISLKRQQAIAAAKKRATDREQQLVGCFQ